MKLYAKEIVKLILSKENLTQKELTKILTEKVGKNIHKTDFQEN